MKYLIKTRNTTVATCDERSLGRSIIRSIARTLGNENPVSLIETKTGETLVSWRGKKCLYSVASPLGKRPAEHPIAHLVVANQRIPSTRTEPIPWYYCGTGLWSDKRQNALEYGTLSKAIAAAASVAIPGRLSRAFARLAAIA